MDRDNKIIPFETLEVSTATVMVYSNIEFDRLSIFKSVPITRVTPSLTKKKKNIDKKKLKSSYGTIISAQHGTYLRGIRMSKKKKYVCPLCQIIEVKDGKEIYIETVTEKEEITSEGYSKITFWCNACKKNIEPEKLKRIVPFLNQLTLSISLGHIIVNVMMFKDNFKITGVKSLENAYEIIMLLWEEYICNTTYWTYKNGGENSARFLFELVMKNVKFKLNFPINKCEANLLMNRAELKGKIKKSQCETTSSTNVNIKMKSKRPTNFRYNILIYNDKGHNGNNGPHDWAQPYFRQSLTKLYAEKEKESPFVTFILFSSAQTILTGRYDENMRDRYYFFIKTILEHKDKISEKIERPRMGIQEFLSQYRNSQLKTLTSPKENLDRTLSDLTPVKKADQIVIAIKDIKKEIKTKGQEFIKKFPPHKNSQRKEIKS